MTVLGIFWLLLFLLAVTWVATLFLAIVGVALGLSSVSRGRPTWCWVRGLEFHFRSSNGVSGGRSICPVVLALFDRSTLNISCVRVVLALAKLDLVVTWITIFLRSAMLLSRERTALRLNLGVIGLGRFFEFLELQAQTLPGRNEGARLCHVGKGKWEGFRNCLGD